MPSSVGVAQEIQVGENVVLDSVSPTQPYGVVFEDDGETGYFYGLRITRNGQAILDALQVYNVESVIDRFKPSRIRIIWSEDGLKSALYVNDIAHAVFDFDAQRGWCRSGFPPPKADWSSQGHEWDDTVMGLFK